ncbi:hypothetical protein BD289DRAFT_45129 [Coniella lustricola]|uniref:Uncharacterized protein n=1 Tax=Coniella lustricola TaxID=2025994 RepID=A0A2T3A1J9_9PEZI|nr:hypothetical protein BD289DRAFT_45129 [Coniella lustricola]
MCVLHIECWISLFIHLRSSQLSKTPDRFAYRSFPFQTWPPSIEDSSAIRIAPIFIHIHYRLVYSAVLYTMYIKMQLSNT